MFVGINPGHVRRLLEFRPLVALGGISYGMYLYHPIVLALAVRAQPWIPVNVSEQGVGRFLIATIGTLLVAALSWLVFERPINAFKRYFPYVARKDLVARTATYAASTGVRKSALDGQRAVYLLASLPNVVKVSIPICSAADRS